MERIVKAKERCSCLKRCRIFKPSSKMSAHYKLALNGWSSLRDYSSFRALAFLQPSRPIDRMLHEELCLSLRARPNRALIACQSAKSAMIIIINFDRIATSRWRLPQDTLATRRRPVPDKILSVRFRSTLGSITVMQCPPVAILNICTRELDFLWGIVCSSGKVTLWSWWVF